MLGCHLCNKKVREISALLDIPRSTASHIKWKRLGTTATQPRSGRQRKITERGQRLLRHMVHKSGQRSADSIAKGFRASTGINVSTKTVRLELHGMGFHGRTAACQPHIASPMPSVGWSGVKHTDTGRWSSGNVFCGVTNHVSLFDSQTLPA